MNSLRKFDIICQIRDGEILVGAYLDETHKDISEYTISELSNYLVYLRKRYNKLSEIEVIRNRYNHNNKSCKKRST